MRIIDSKKNEFGSTSYVVLSARQIWLVETLVPFEELCAPSVNRAAVVYKRAFGNGWQCGLHRAHGEYTNRELWRRASAARRAMRLHR